MTSWRAAYSVQAVGQHTQQCTANCEHHCGKCGRAVLTGTVFAPLAGGLQLCAPCMLSATRQHGAGSLGAAGCLCAACCAERRALAAATRAFYADPCAVCGGGYHSTAGHAAVAAAHAAVQA